MQWALVHAGVIATTVSSKLLVDQSASHATTVKQLSSRVRYAEQTDTRTDAQVDKHAENMMRSLVVISTVVSMQQNSVCRGSHLQCIR